MYVLKLESLFVGSIGGLKSTWHCTIVDASVQANAGDGSPGLTQSADVVGGSRTAFALFRCCIVLKIESRKIEKHSSLWIPSRSNDFANEEMSVYQRFRAGIEGSISFLKRCFGLTRVNYKGFKGFCRGVGLSVFCHNLLVMARQDLSSD